MLSFFVTHLLCAGASAMYTHANLHIDMADPTDEFVTEQEKDDVDDVDGVDDVIESLVRFSKVTSESMADTQKNICQLLRIANAHEIEIARLRKLIESSMVREKVAVEENVPTGVTLESVMQDADSLRESVEYDDLMKKIEDRKKNIGLPPERPKQKKELEIEAARASILSMARQHATTVATNAV